MKARSLFSENQYITGVRTTLSENHKKREVRTSKSENHAFAEVRTTLSENHAPTKNSPQGFECVEFLDFSGRPQRRYYEKKSQ
mgnify:CR=1 FL=1